MKHYLFLIWLLNPFSASASDEKITVLTEQLYPLSYTETRKSNGVIKGYATELVKAVLEESGFDYEIRMTPWPRIISSLEKQKNVLAYSVAHTEEREEQFYWIGEIISMKISLYGLERNRANLPNTFEEAKSFRIAVNRDSVVSDFLKENDFKRLVEINNREKYMLLLERNRFDLFPLIDFTLPFLAERVNLNSTHYYPAVALSALTKNLTIALSVNSSNEVRERIAKAYNIVKKSGRYDEIMSPLLLQIEQEN
ncbi:MAG: transporter substrate-binding domain-containing protein [Pseudomonadales bacterium]|nr:transporter substrate-binding domain-containing protein [Pseudomonadales bacterium]